MDSFDLSLLQFAFVVAEGLWQNLVIAFVCSFETVLHFNWLILRFSRLFVTYLIVFGGMQPGFFHLQATSDGHVFWHKINSYSLTPLKEIILIHYFVRIIAKLVILAPCCCSWQWWPWKKIIGNWTFPPEMDTVGRALLQGHKPGVQVRY